MSHKCEDLFFSRDSYSCKEQNRLTPDNTRMDDRCFKSSNVDSSGGEICADNTVLKDKCIVVDDSLSEYSMNDISQTDNDLSFLDNDGWLDIGNLEDVDRLISCDLTFGMGSLNNEEEFCWLSSSHGPEGSDDALKSDFKFSSAEVSPLKSISYYNLDPDENIECLPMNDCNKKESSIDKRMRSQIDVDHDAVPASLSTFSESDLKSGYTEVLVPEHKMQGKLSRPSAGKRKNGYQENGNSDHHYVHVEQYANLKQPFGASSSGITSLDSIQKHRSNMDPDSLGCIQIQSPSMRSNHSHTSNYTCLLPPSSRSRSEHDGLPSPFRESSYASSGHSLDFSALKTSGKRENLYLCHDSQLFSRDFKNENKLSPSPMPFKSPDSARKVGHQFENENGSLSEAEGVSIGFSQETDSSNVRESSSMSSALDEISPQATSFRQLQQVMDQLDIRTKLCIRDSLYRLAKSAEQRHNDPIASGQMGNDVESRQATQDGNRCTGFMNMETNTNPIDRSIAHLLFHRPSDPSILPLNDRLPFKSSSMIPESVTNPPAMTEKQVCEEESSAGLENKSLGGTPSEK